MVIIREAGTFPCRGCLSFVEFKNGFVRVEKVIGGQPLPLG